MPTEVPAQTSTRLVSIDAYRGFVMLLMMGEVLSLGRVARALPDSGFWAFLAHQQSHVAWVGCTLHDLIQPSFSFLVGVALPFSLAARLGRGQSWLKLRLHAAWRAFALVALGIFLRSVGAKQTNFTFEDTLTQIGLGYFILFLLGEGFVKLQPSNQSLAGEVAPTTPKSGFRTAWIALAVILIGYWALFARYPLPGPDFDWQRAGTSADWSGNLMGFAAHWNRNTNPAWAFDAWFMNLFPRQNPFTNNGGGYSTLSFIPTLGTMILGLIAGGWLRAGLPQRDLLRRLVLAGLVGLALGWLFNATGVCPNVKRIWTPTWVLFSGGWCFLLLAAFHFLTEARGWRAWAFPLVVIGANSIAAYCIAHLTEGLIESSLRTHLGDGFFLLSGAPYKPLFFGACTLFVEWLILHWMYRRRIFLKI
jgi:predicted acyltransferase